MRNGLFGGVMPMLMLTLMAACAVVVALWAGAGLPSSAVASPRVIGPPPWNGDGQASVTVEAKERPLASVVAEIEEAAGVNLLVTEEAADLPVTVALKDVSWREALNVVVEKAGGTVVRRSPHVLVIDRPPRVTFEFEDAEVRQIISAVTQMARANVLIAPEVEGRLTQSFADLPWRAALGATVKAAGYVVVEEASDILLIADPAALGDRAARRATTARPDVGDDSAPRVSLDLSKRPLEEAIAAIQKVTDVRLVLGADAAAPPITVKLKNVPWREALQFVARESGCLLRDFGPRVIRVERPARVTFQFERADVRIVIGAVADIASANIVMTPEVQGTVSLTLHDVPWPTALETIVRSIGYQVVEERLGILRIVDPANRAASRQGGGPRLTPGAGETSDSLVTFDVEKRPLGEVLALIGEQTDVNLLPTPDAAKVEVTLKLTNLPWREALELVAESTRCRLVARSPRIIEIDRPPRVTFEFDNADLKVVIQAIASIARANVVIAPEVEGTVTARLHDVPWRDALEAVVRTLGYTVSEEDQGILRIHAPAERPR